MMFPLPVWWDGPKCFAELGVRLLCLSMLKKAKAKQTFLAGLRILRQVATSQSWWSRVGRMGSQWCGGVLMVMSTARSRQLTASTVKPSCCEEI